MISKKQKTKQNNKLNNKLEVVMKEILLHKQNANGKRQIWHAKIVGATYYITYGIEGGKFQTETKTVLKGKNIGKKNYSSPEQQAEFLVANKARKKIEANEYTIIKGKDILEANRNKETQFVHDVPKPMLAHDAKKRLKYEQHVEFWAQPKIDGYRCLCSKNNLFSRKRKEITGKIPHIIPFIQSYFEELDAEYLDGEVFSDKIDFNTLQSILNKKPEKMTAEDYEIAKMIKLNLFDYIPKNSNETQDERMKKLQKLKNNKYVDIVYPEKITISEIQQKHDEYVARGYEGLMLRTLDAVYEHKRSFSLLKYKMFDDAEAKIVGFKHEKNRPDKLGSLIMEFPNGVQFDARPKITHKAMDEMWNNQDAWIGVVGVVRFQGYMPSGKPRFPRYIGMRSEIDMPDDNDDDNENE